MDSWGTAFVHGGPMITADPPGAIRYNGTVTSFSANTAWGFIACPDLAAVYSKDIFFHLKDCGGATISKGQKVSFLLEEANVLGKPQARAIRGSQHTPDPPNAIRYVGTVTSFSTASAWGFIACSELSALYQKDIFFHLKDCGGASISKGQTVSFLLDENNEPSKPQARSIRVSQDDSESSGLARYRGIVTNYSIATAWGFIQCPDLTAVYGKDIFFHTKDCGGALVAKGTAVTFVLDDSTDPSKPQARNIRIEATKGYTSQGVSFPQMQQANTSLLGDNTVSAIMSDSLSASSTFTGTIQSFSEQAGWGFIECPALGLEGGKGIFFHVKDCIGMATLPPTRGTCVTFTLGYGPSGKPQAVQVCCSNQAQGNGPFVGTKRTAATASGLSIDPQVLAMAGLHNLQMLTMDNPSKKPRA